MFHIHNNWYNKQQLIHLNNDRNHFLLRWKRKQNKYIYICLLIVQDIYPIGISCYIAYIIIISVAFVVIIKLGIVQILITTLVLH